METLIKNYRINSAKWMGLNYDIIPRYKTHKIEVKIGNEWTEWLPDQDHNQMAIMIGKLQKENILTSLFFEDEGECWVRLNELDDDNFGDILDSDIRIAFMKAWNEYYESLNQ